MLTLRYKVTQNQNKRLNLLKKEKKESKKKWLLDNAAIIEINRKIDAAKETKNKAKIRISKLEKRKTNISKKTNNEIEKLEKAKNDYIHTKMAKSEWEWLQVVKKYGGDLIKVPVAMRTEELCELAVKSSGSALEYVPEELRTLDLCELAVKQIGGTRVFDEYVPKNIQLELVKKYIIDVTI